MAGTLYIVATPIGHLEDISFRAIRTLKEADIIAAEDTRVTRKLLSHYDIHTPMIAYHQHSKGRRSEEILAMLLDEKSVALVSDAGTPGISDPGHELIALCIAEDVPVTSVPGPTAVIAALVASGLPTAHFIFDGFPPRKDSDRIAYFSSVKHETRTICLYESPGRLLKTLKALRSELGERHVVVVREATKMFEEIFRGTASEVMEHFSKGEIRGEIVLMVHGITPEEAEQQENPEINVENRLLELLEVGMSERDAVRQAMIEFKLPKRLVYSLALKIKASQEPSPEPET